MRGQRPDSEATETERWMRERFSLPKLRPHQAEVVQALLRGRRVLFVAPTGHGKSLCYQALAAHPEKSGVVLVFQPLKALMHEQVERAQQRGLRAALVNSDQTREVQEEVLQAAAKGRLDVLFLAPERQGNDLWLGAVEQMEIKGVVIDEAHCISQWGHDFRPWYRRLVQTIMGLSRRTPVLAVTATAPPKVIQDIEGQIAAEVGAEVVRLPSYRSNLACAVWAVSGLPGRLAALLRIARQRSGQPGIAYWLTTFETEMAAQFLCQQGIKAVAYFGRLTPEERQACLQKWQRGEADVICATSALGMGVDRQDVRWVAHLGLPDSLIRYVQEIGRAGRDGAPAHVTAVHDPECDSLYRGLLHSSQPEPGEYEQIAGLLQQQPAGRTRIIEELDIREPTVQRILEDLVTAKLCTREGEPFKYSWCGGRKSPVPEGAQEALQVRQEFLQESLGYPLVAGCRAVALAKAMGDETLPEPCESCDRCLDESAPDLAGEGAHAQEFLDAFTLPIRQAKQGSAVVHREGLALALYGMGRLGSAIKQAKYARQPAPAVLLDLALKALQIPMGPYSGLQFDTVVCLPSTSFGDFVPGFAGALASRLGLSCVVLEKTRQTQQQKSFHSRHCKKRNVQGAFRLPVGVRCPGRVLLVDDIYDSGASLIEAARVLRPATVYPLTMARTRHTDDS